MGSSQMGKMATGPAIVTHRHRIVHIVMDIHEMGEVMYIHSGLLFAV